MLDIHMIAKLLYSLKKMIRQTICQLWVDRVHFHVLMRCWCTVIQLVLCSSASHICRAGLSTCSRLTNFICRSSMQLNSPVVAGELSGACQCCCGAYHPSSGLLLLNSLVNNFNIVTLLSEKLSLPLGLCQWLCVLLQYLQNPLNLIYSSLRHLCCDGLRCCHSFAALLMLFNWPSWLTSMQRHLLLLTFLTLSSTFTKG